MFNRLISNLPFNPSLITQVSFYSKRLKQETSVRRLGFVFMALTLFVQMFAVIAPPQPSLAHDANNDLIPGGFVSQTDAVNRCNSNDNHFGDILRHFGATCQQLSAGTVQTIGSRDHNSQLYSVGRLQYNKPGEYAEHVPGVATVFVRPLWSWDGGSPTSYKAVVINRVGKTPLMVLFNCGNVTLIKTTPPPPPPAKSIVCSSLDMNITPGTRIKKGTTITLSGRATGTNLPDGQTVDMYYDSIDATKKTPVMAPQLGAKGVQFVNGVAKDSTSHSYKLDQPGHYVFRLAVKYDNGKDAAGNLAGGCARDVFVEQTVTDLCPSIPGVQTNRESCDVCPDVPGAQENTAECKPCEKAQDGNDTVSCLTLGKTARNDTQRIANADGTTAKGGDVITYTLTVTNTGKAAAKNFVVTDNISDTLDYADVTDYHGASKDSQNVVAWPPLTIKAGETIQKQLTIKVKDPIPITPASTSNPGKFDLTMTNVYSNATNIKLVAPSVKAVEHVNTTLPNTGPGANLAIAFGLVATIGYFFARSRLMAKELDMIRMEYASGM